MRYSCLLVAFVPALARAAQEAPVPARPAISVAAVDAAIRRGAEWLRERQREDGAFAPASGHEVCPVALTAMALWSLNQPEPRCASAEQVERAARFLLAQRQPDGGIYDPARGLAVYTSGVVACALRTLDDGAAPPELASARASAELFAYRRQAPESVIDAAGPGEVTVGQSGAVARALLESTPDLDAARRRALEFLANCDRELVRAPARLRSGESSASRTEIGAFSYDDLLPFVYAELSPEQQIALRAQAALRAHYTPDRNPDLTKRYGAAGFPEGTQGLYYYFFVSAKTLSTFRQRTLVKADGSQHDWASEIAVRLVRAQREDGAWANADTRWWESEPVLTSAYALLTLKLCRAELAR